MAEPSETTQTHGRNSNRRQFWLLLWKIWLLQRKHMVVAFVVLVCSVIWVYCLILIREGSKISFVRRVTTYDSFLVTTNLIHDLRHPPEKLIIAYSPNTILVARIVNRATTLMGIKYSPDLGFAAESELVDYLTANEDIFGAIVFDVSKDSTNLPTKISYKIRLRSDRRSSGSDERVRVKWNTNATFPAQDNYQPRNDTGPVYKEEGFLAIQMAVDLSLIAEVNQSFDPTTMNVTTQLKQYPFPPYNADAMIGVIEHTMSVFILISFIIIAPIICQEIVLEKENKFKDLMKLMGMRSWLYWSSWFVKYLLFMIIAVFIMTVMLHGPFSRYGSVIAYSSSTVTFVFLMLYSISIITFCFVISTLFSKATYGAAVCCVLYFLSFMPVFFLKKVYNKMTLSQKLAASLDFNVAMGFGFKKIDEYEAIGIALQWSNIWSSANTEDDYTMAHVLIMLLVDTVIYSILTLYLDAVIPGEFGTTQPFYFLFTREYWLGRRGNKIKLSAEDFMTLIPEDRRPYFETPLQNAKAGIQLRGLTKKFGWKSKPAVNDLNIDMYENNITALVGHNGAGKTTAMLMLTGFLPPSKGTAFINGFDITRETDVIRQNLGLCPQHSILYETLTVGEHLLFFAVLKGSSFRKASLETNEMVNVLHMKSRINSEVKTLSGGHRRKLSVGIALISGSKFVILDEPTSGMDPQARRQIWDILQGQRKDRTIILSTHYMDEADILGDRIAIMANGELRCYGTPMFLKNKYGVGYHMTMVKTSTCDVDQLRDVIKSQIPTANMVSNESEEVTFVLPSNQASKFEELFETLETDGKTLGIESFGISITTIEEVFLKVNDSSALEAGRLVSTTTDAERHGGTNSDADVLYQKETGWRRQNLQLRAMFYKRFIHSIRNYALTLCQLLSPVLFAVLGCVVLLHPPGDSNFPSLTLDLTHFKSSITPYDVQPPQSEYGRKLSSCYEACVSRQSKPVSINSEPGYSTMDKYLIGIGKDHIYEYNWNYQIGATIEDTPSGNLNITGYFNNQSYHTIAISLSYIGNTLMQCFGSKNYQIVTINHPLPRNSSEQIKDIVEQERNPQISFSSCLLIGLAFLFPTFLGFLIKERKSGAKLSQLVSGVKLQIFWLTTFLWDYVNYLVPCFFIIIVVLSFHTEGNWQNTWIIFIGLMLCGFSMLPLIYIMSFLFKESSTGFIWLSFICFMTGPFSFINTIWLQSRMSQKIWLNVEWIFYAFFPMYCLQAVLENIYNNYNNHKLCIKLAQGLKLDDFCAYVKRLDLSNPCCPGNCGEECVIADNYFSWTLPGVGRPVFFMVFQCIVFFLILYIIESKIIRRRLINPFKSKGEALIAEINAAEYGTTGDDLDVTHERQSIHWTPVEELIETGPVIIKDLTKLYDNVVAVNQLSIGVSPKECFGLLGVNGAGKTTVFKMLTGEIRPSFGSAYVAGKSVEDDIAEVRQKIGYCPQFDSIIDQLTVQETLWMYACAHGIPAEVRQGVIDRLIERLTLKPYTRKQAGKLSGGNKRKLCVAVALMGNPTVVFLDEPTTGVDPEARRHVWNTLAAARNTGATIILTSHSMEECEAICTRVGILVSGRFGCLGSLQHLRDKFGDGYTLIIKLQRSADKDKPEELKERIDKLKSFISQTFPDSVLKDQHENLLNYRVKTRSFKWSELFGIMEKARVKYEIEDYSVGQTTLEQIFVGFARQQQGSLKIPKKICCHLLTEEERRVNTINPMFLYF